VEEVDGWEQRHSQNTPFGVLKGLLYTEDSNHMRPVTESRVKSAYACPCARGDGYFCRYVEMMT